MRNESVLTIAEVVNATHYFNLNGDPIVEEIVNEKKQVAELPENEVQE